jgi:hypothetical protein
VDSWFTEVVYGPSRAAIRLSINGTDLTARVKGHVACKHEAKKVLETPANNHALCHVAAPATHLTLDI